MTSSAGVLVADPPWPFRDRLPGPGRGAARHYPLLSIADIKSFPLPPIADDAWLFLWRVGAMAEEALEVCRAWRFEPTGGELVWIKTTRPALLIADPSREAARSVAGSGLAASVAIGMGRTVRNAHEVCLIARRGKPARFDAGIRSIFFAPVGRHSEKPAEFYRLVERFGGDVPRAELFARQRRDGWRCYGNEVEP